MNEIGQERVASVEQKAYAKVSKDDDIEPYDFEDCKYKSTFPLVSQTTMEETPNTTKSM